MRAFVRNWIERHQHPVSQTLHAVGIPLAFVGLPVLLVLGRYGWAAAAFVAGFALQFLGHAFEGNDPGEIILVKKLLGKPYVEFGRGSPKNRGKGDQP